MSLDVFKRSSYVRIYCPTSSCVQAGIHTRRRRRLLCSTSRSCSRCICCSLSTFKTIVSWSRSAQTQAALQSDEVPSVQDRTTSYRRRSASPCTVADTSTVRRRLDLYYTLRSSSHTLYRHRK